MGMFTLLTGLLLLLAQPAVSRISPYDPDDNLRPDNVTRLEYKYYDKIGSYYNGTFTLEISPLYNPTPQPAFGKTCREEYENKTLEIPMNAIIGFQEVAPKAPSPNPFFLNLYAWDRGYNLSHQYQTANYSDFQENLISSNLDYAGNTTWHYNITKNDTESWYNFGGLMETWFLRHQVFKFNVSGLCDGGPESELLFSGSLLAPDPRIEYDWTKNPIAVPTIWGAFNEEQASLVISGLFRAVSRNTEMVGEIRMSFDGMIDEERSDQLFMNRKTPEWNATLGFEVDAVGGAESAAATFAPRGFSSLVALLAFCVIVMQ